MVSKGYVEPDNTFSQIEEQLSTFDVCGFSPDNFELVDNQWGWEPEQIMNQGLDVIFPSCNEVAFTQSDTMDSPPASVNNYKVNSDWNIEEMLDIQTIPILEQENWDESIFDLDRTNPISTDPVGHSPKLPIGGKRIDMKAQCYITHNNERVSPKVNYSDTEDSDNEDNINRSGLEYNNTSSDMQSSSKQHENKERNKVINHQIKNQGYNEVIIQQGENLEHEIVDIDGLSNDEPVLLAGDVNSLFEQFEAKIDIPRKTEIEQNKNLQQIPQINNLKRYPYEQKSHPQNLQQTSEIGNSKRSPSEQKSLLQNSQQITNNLKKYPSESKSFLQKSQINNLKKYPSEQMSRVENLQQIPPITNNWKKCVSEQKSLPQNLQQTQQISNNSKRYLSVKHPQVGETTTQRIKGSTVTLNRKSVNPQLNGHETNKEICAALPPELVKRIENNNRKTIIIEPLPNKSQVLLTKTQQERSQDNRNARAVTLDHDYCLPKDSGFTSEDDNTQNHSRAIVINERTLLKSNFLKRQLNSVNALKVNGNVSLNHSTSLLSTSKPSTSNGVPIQSSSSAKDKRKRKLNLDEYKKRRQLPGSNGSSLNNSPRNSGPCSPNTAKGEQECYQLRLTQMAAELLKATPKNLPQAITSASTPAQTEATVLEQSTSALPTLPAHLERKEFISIGVNTDGAGLKMEHLNVNLSELEEIRPILENASDKISSNSLIASMIENVQNKKIKDRLGQNELNKRISDQAHGEDKIIMWPEKNRPKKPTKDVAVQTSIIIETNFRGYKRKRSSSSSSSNEDRKSASRESHYSYSSPSSSYSYSSSRSHSPSSPDPRSRRRDDVNDHEHLREVNERRIVYVGGISPSMTKEDLIRRFGKFGEITNVSVHYQRNRFSESYGFVTYRNNKDAYKAVEHGNDDPHLPQLDLNFGGRRLFCQARYSDLDNVCEENTSYSPAQNNSFDQLLLEVQAKLRKRNA